MEFFPDRRVITAAELKQLMESPPDLSGPSTCPHCGSELVEVDNPMRREFRHRRGMECTGG